MVAQCVLKMWLEHSTILRKFIDIVNGVLKQYSGKVVEELDVKFEFDATLAEHLDDWVNFALSSRAKNLALDLLPAKFGLHPDRGRWIPFHLGHALAVKDARVNFIGKMTLEFALNALPNLLPGVQNLILHSSLPLKTPRLQGNCSKFCQLKFFVLVEDLSNLLWLASFLRAAPFIEKLDIHFSICAFPHCPELIRSLPISKEPDHHRICRVHGSS
ncbi:uncharacterized protein LOC112893150 isoform X2 [Panicum hallii]|uniref:uncharacterized protein LOC112893150 isoform X2 n=1 Tax=Panicum hallii TaxID=206008 RepID=UPI000DF4DA2E|nr:uncharacterized protein LOC112893150 isoform X2 [Panicum hallii]